MYKCGFWNKNDMYHVHGKSYRNILLTSRAYINVHGIYIYMYKPRTHALTAGYGMVYIEKVEELEFSIVFWTLQQQQLYCYSSVSPTCIGPCMCMHG